MAVCQEGEREQTLSTGSDKQTVAEFQLIYSQRVSRAGEGNGRDNDSASRGDGELAIHLSLIEMFTWQLLN